MTRSPSKNIPLARLRAIQAENGIAANGTEYAPDELDARIHELAQKKVDDFDFGAVQERRLRLREQSRRKKQGTRLNKLWCPDCGYTIRVTQKWIMLLGAPLCPCSRVPMEMT